MAENQKSHSRRTLWLLGTLALAVSIATLSLVHHYGATRPTTMETGHTHAVKIHSRTVYLTRGEYDAAFTLHVIAIVAIGAFLGMLMKSRGKHFEPRT